MSNDLLAWVWLAFPLGLGLGFIIGGRQEAQYWADHGDNGGDVYHKGKFYRVIKKDIPAE